MRLTAKYEVRLTREAEQQYKNLAHMGEVLVQQARRVLQQLEDDPRPDGETRTALPYPFGGRFYARCEPGWVAAIYVIDEDRNTVQVLRFTQTLFL